ncbi:MAG: pilus assembly protein PilM [Verrucomicrobiae bacterium]|nr:pilus assembly protein PilM [Verrucomicrobiae bacterium]
MEASAAGLSVADFCLLEAPYNRGKNHLLTAEDYAEHFRQIRHALGGTKVRNLVVVLRCQESLLQLAELPPMPVSTLREVLQRNSKLYLKEEYPNHVFDCHVQQTLARDTTAGAEGKDSKAPAADAAKTAAAKAKKTPVLVGGARRELVDALARGARAAGFKLMQVVPGGMALVQGMKTPQSGDLTTIIANFDLGLEQTLVSILSHGEVVQSRIIPMGGRNLTAGLAEAMNVTLEAAESVKVLLPNTVDSKLELLLAPLAQELKASVDFFESQFEQKVSTVYLSGGAARSPQILQIIEKMTHLPCRPWHLPDNVTLNLSPDRAAAFKRDMPLFMGAVGAAMEALEAIPRGLNLLATQLAEELRRQRSPVRIAFAVAGVICALMLLWSAVLGWKLVAENASLKSDPLALLQRRAAEARVLQKSVQGYRSRIQSLQQQAASRYLVAPLLDALQRSLVEDIVITRITVQRTPLTVAKGKKQEQREAMVLNIHAKDYSELGATDAFIDALASNPYFKKRLPGPESVVLKQRSSRQPDTANPGASFALINIECLLVE